MKQGLPPPPRTGSVLQPQATGHLATVKAAHCNVTLQRQTSRPAPFTAGTCDFDATERSVYLGGILCEYDWRRTDAPDEISSSIAGARD